MVKSSPTRRRPRGAWVLLLLLCFVAGLLVAARTPDIPADVLEARYGTPPSKFVTLPSGARVHYRDQGPADAPVLVLLHGSNSSLFTWEPWVARLSDSLRVVTLDLPGHGLTGAVPGDDYSPDGMAAFLDEFRIRLGLRHFYLGGNSMGGGVSFRYTLAHPDVVDKLILVDAGGIKHLLPADKVPPPPIGFRLASMPVLNRIAGFITPRSVVEKTALVAYGDPRLLTKSVSDRLYDLLLYPGNRRATRLRFAAPVDTRAADRLGEIHAPTLILWGDLDAMIPVDAADIFHQRIAGSQLIEYPGVGHLPMEAVPDRSAADVKAFLLGK